MKNRLLWKTAAGRLAPLVTLDKGENRSIILTTVKDFQRGGKIEFFWEDDRGTLEAESIKIRNLPPNRPGEPVISLNCVYNGKNQIKLTIISSKNTLEQRIFRVPERFQKESRSNIPLILGLIAAGLLAGAALFWFLLLSPILSEKQENEPTVRASALPSRASEEQNTSVPSGVAAMIHPPTAESEDTADSISKPPPLEREAQEALPITNKAAETDKTAPPLSEAPAVVLEPFRLTVYFRPESAEITPEAIDGLKKIADLPSPYNYSRILITGHCALYGTEEERVELSHQRAENITTLLKTLIDFPKQVNSGGEGGKIPVTRDRDKQKLNRRVEIELIP